MTLRFTADLPGEEDEDEVYLLYNFRNAPVEKAVARATLELAHWVLQRNGIIAPLGFLEYVDLFTRKTYKFLKVRDLTIRRARGNARVVVQRWPTL